MRMLGTTAALGEANKAARHDLSGWKPVSFNVGVRRRRHGATSSRGKAASHDLPDESRIGSPDCQDNAKPPSAKEFHLTCNTARPRATTLLARLRAPMRRNHARTRQSPSRPLQLRIDLDAQEEGAGKGLDRSPCHNRPSTRGRCQLSRNHLVQQKDHRATTSSGCAPAVQRARMTPRRPETARHDLIGSPYSAGGCGTMVLLRSRPRRNHGGRPTRPRQAQKQEQEYRPKDLVAQRGREP